MAKIKRSIIIDAPEEKVFTYINDPNLNPERLPGMVEVKDVAISEQAVGSHFRWVYKIAGNDTALLNHNMLMHEA